MKPNQEKVLKFITIGGATAAGLATLGVVGLPLVETVGIVSGAVLLGDKLKHKDLNIQSDAELKHTFKNSAFIALGALGAHIIAQALPMTHLLEYGTTIGIVTGVAGMVTAKVQENKNKRPKM